MWPVSATFLAACRTSHAIVTTCTFKDAFTSAQTVLPVEDGNVTVDVTAAIRRTLNLNLPPLQSIYDVLAVPGGEITVTQGIRYIDGTTETVPLGVFCVDQQRMTYRPDGTFTLTAPDRWLHVQRNAFGLNRVSVPSNAGWTEIKRLVEAAWPNAGFPFPGWATITGVTNPDQSATTKVGAQLWDDGSRETAIQNIATANSVDVRFDAQGFAVLQPIPVLTSSSTVAWTVDAAGNGVFEDGDRQRDLTLTRNAVIVSSSAADVVMTPVEVKDVHTPSSDPLSTLGPLGYVPFNFDSPLIRNTTQATAAGKTILQKQLGVQMQLSLTAAPNPALDGYDVISVVFPPGDWGTTRPTETHLIESVTIPLTPSGTQQITTRSTRTTADDTV